MKCVSVVFSVRCHCKTVCKQIFLTSQLRWCEVTSETSLESGSEGGILFQFRCRCYKNNLYGNYKRMIPLSLQFSKTGFVQLSPAPSEPMTRTKFMVLYCNVTSALERHSQRSCLGSEAQFTQFGSQFLSEACGCFLCTCLLWLLVIYFYIWFVAVLNSTKLLLLSDHDHPFGTCKFNVKIGLNQSISFNLR